jgi:hypothetical protein
MSELFQKSRSTINEHIINIYNEGELKKEPSLRKIVISDFSTKPTIDPSLEMSVIFFKTVQNKIHLATHSATDDRRGMYEKPSLFCFTGL